MKKEPTLDGLTQTVLNELFKATRQGKFGMKTSMLEWFVVELDELCSDEEFAGALRRLIDRGLITEDGEFVQYIPPKTKDGHETN